MNNKSKLEIIVVDLLRNSLNISDKLIIYKLYENVQKLDINELTSLLENLTEKQKKQNQILWQIDLDIKVAKFKLEEISDQHLEGSDINLLIK